MRAKQNPLVLFLFTLFICAATTGLAKDSLVPSQGQQTSGSVNVKEMATKLPSLPPGTTELNFSDFFVSPVGDRGLTLTEKLLSLEGQRVRILGYMVRQENRAPGKFLLAPLPVEVHEHDSTFADDLPASTIHVFVPGYNQRLPHTSKPLLLTGLLSVGNREEGDGRISIVRLTLDAPPPPARTPKTFPNEKGAQRLILTTAREKSR